MGQLVLWRLVQLPIILGVIFVITLMLAWIMPGDPLQREGEKKLPEAVTQTLRAEYDLDKGPTHFGVQYLKNAVVGKKVGNEYHWPDFGPSLANPSLRVRDIIARSLPVSATLGAIALVFALFIGTTAGVVGALRPGSLLDASSLGVALIGISLPTFVTGAVLLAVFAATFGMVAGDFWSWPNMTFWHPEWKDYYQRGDFAHDAKGMVQKTLLPALALSLAPAAYIARLIRLGLAEIMSSDYVRTAEAKGLSRRAALFKHAMKVAYLPVLSFLGPAAAGTMTGSFVVEKIFNLPGLGDHFVKAVVNKDQFLILGLVLTYATILVLFNLIVDMAYAWLDPRIDLSSG